jgi:hypothetical protein
VLDSEALSVISDRFVAYLKRQCSFCDVASVLMRHVGNTNAIERIQQIVHIGDRPLMCSAMPPPNATSDQQGRKKMRPWNSYEDQRLLAGIYRFGLDSWPIVAEFVGNGRTRAQCSQRWLRGLDPHIAKEQWTIEADERLLSLVALHGNKSWTQISGEMGNRCDVQCRYRYKQLCKSVNFQEMMQKAQERTKGLRHIARPRKRQNRTKAFAIFQTPPEYQFAVPQMVGVPPPIYPHIPMIASNCPPPMVTSSTLSQLLSYGPLYVIGQQSPEAELTLPLPLPPQFD